jgi:hypothetical protein
MAPGLTSRPPEALTGALAQIRSGTPLVVRDEGSGQREVLWAPEDQD